MSSRRNTKWTFTLGATQQLANVKATSLGTDGRLDIQVVIDGGTDGVAPADSPAGAFQLWCSSDPDGQIWTRVTSADTELAKVAPNGNNAVSAYAVLEDAPGTQFKLIYVRTSGGAATRARVCVTV